MTDITTVETPTLGPALDFPEWKDMGAAIAKEHARHQWIIADWIREGIDTFPAAEVYAEALKLFPQYSKATLITWASVAKAFPPFIRNKGLTFSHHQAAMIDIFGRSNEDADAPLTAMARQGKLAAAAENGWTVSQLRDYISHELDIRMTAKEAERLAAEQPVGPPTPRKPKGRPLSAWTLAYLPAAYRSKLEKLAIARCMPAPTLAQSIIEQALDDAEEEIQACADSAYRAEAARKRWEETKKANAVREALARRFEIDKLIREHGGTEADYEAAIQEWKDRVKAMKASGLDYYPGDAGSRSYMPGGRGFINFYEYAAWRVHKMEDQAWEENARLNREAIEAKAWAENAQRDRELAEIEAESTEESDISEEEILAL